MISFMIIIMFIIRLLFLKISITNEKKILSSGGKEYGVNVSKAITTLHILFYLSCFIEAILVGATIDTIGVIGLLLMIFSIMMLYVVTRLLGEIWTVKLMIAKEHRFVDHWLFRTIKHPNYFLNILPELVGIGLLCHAKVSTCIILPLYAVILYLRIRQENHLIKTIILPNSKLEE